jgi:leader peptidase (prepilin peptidase)/N-methyltransferase
MSLFDYLQAVPTAFYLVMGVSGLLAGSFLNVVILRLPRMLQYSWRQECRDLLEHEDATGPQMEPVNLIRPRSHCPHCNHPITALENIPLVSYLLLRGKCSACHKPISIRYPIIELASCLLAVILAWHYGYGIQALLAVLLSWALLAVSVIDIDHQLLPDDITLPILWLGLLVNMFGIFTDIYSSLIGAMAGYGILWTVFMLFRLCTGKDGMGYGDFKLLAALGAWLGWQMLPLIIILSSVCGAVIGIAMIVARKHERDRPIPFGPYLAMAGWIAMIWGQALTSIYTTWVMKP